MSPLGERLAWIVTTLRAALGAYALRLARPPRPVLLGNHLYHPILKPELLPRLAPALWRLFHARLSRSVERFQALYAAWTAGTLKPPRPSRPRTRKPNPTPTDPPAEPPLRLPRGFAWLNLRAEETVPSAGMLHMLVHDEETQRFVAEVPRAGRLLRPLCQALGVRPPPCLTLPPRPRKPRPRRPRVAAYNAFTDPTLKWRGWELRFARAAIRKNGRG